MDESELSLWKRAGEIAARSRDIGARMIVEGESMIAVAESVEENILAMGGSVAFPVNIALNDYAAHYTPKPDDKQRFKRGDLVKLDVGAHVEGCIGDTAVTIEVGSSTYAPLIAASRRALDSVIEVIRPGVPLATLGSVVERTMNNMGFRPIVNLTGHSIERYKLHAGINVPNYNDRSDALVPSGTVIAVEPFSTTGIGEVSSYKRSNIFRMVRRKGNLTPEQDEALKVISGGPGQLPFSERWLRRKVPKADKAINGLVRAGSLYSYPILRETSGGMVAQSEHTLFISEKGCTVLTI
jgi:methionyl aminopeptidase